MPAGVIAAQEVKLFSGVGGEDTRLTLGDPPCDREEARLGTVQTVCWQTVHLAVMVIPFSCFPGSAAALGAGIR
jgi:hypothetical protein